MSDGGTPSDAGTLTLVPELKDLSYEERLVRLKLATLDYRRKRYDLI